MKELNKYQRISVFSLIVIISGIFGWIYEFIFYYFNSGMKEFYYRGGNFLPWINIYAIGALIVLFFTRKIENKPLLVFITSAASTGILEYVSGYLIYKLGNGARYWDYNTEILNFGNIGGFVCLRSVVFFGLSSLLLVYCIIPLCYYLASKMSKKSFLILSITLCSIILLDDIYNLAIARLLNLPRASDIYKSIGFKYMNSK